jgi:hypothetical protein
MAGGVWVGEVRGVVVRRGRRRGGRVRGRGWWVEEGR